MTKGYDTDLRIAASACLHSFHFETPRLGAALGPAAAQGTPQEEFAAVVVVSGAEIATAPRINGKAGQGSATDAVAGVVEGAVVAVLQAVGGIRTG